METIALHLVLGAKFALQTSTLSYIGGDEHLVLGDDEHLVLAGAVPHLPHRPLPRLRVHTLTVNIFLGDFARLFTAWTCNLLPLLPPGQHLRSPGRLALLPEEVSQEGGGDCSVPGEG